MQQIPSLFVREQRDGKYLATSEVTEGCEWVIAGEGEATEQFDGTACLVSIVTGERLLYRRHRHKAEKGDPPPNWFHWSMDPEQQNGHGWIPVTEAPADRWHREAWRNTETSMAPWTSISPGTYELVGPMVQDNPYGLSDEEHVLWMHGHSIRCDPFAAPRDLEGLLAFLQETYIEGLVWHHPDGRMAKLKRRDFGIPWPPPRRKYA